MKNTKLICASLIAIAAVAVSTQSVANEDANNEQLRAIVRTCSVVVDIAESSRTLFNRGMSPEGIVEMLKVEDENVLAKWLIKDTVPSHIVSQDSLSVRREQSMFRCVGSYYEFKQKGAK